MKNYAIREGADSAVRAVAKKLLQITFLCGCARPMIQEEMDNI